MRRSKLPKESLREPPGKMEMEDLQKGAEAFKTDNKLRFNVEIINLSGKNTEKLNKIGNIEGDINPGKNTKN